MGHSFICVSAKLQLHFDTICALKMPKRSACWTDKLTVELIEEFWKHPELWKVKSSGYFNKYKREEAWERLMKVKYLQTHSTFCTTNSHFLLAFKVFNKARTISLSTLLFLFQVCSMKIPDVTTDQVKMKINTLWSNFRRELVKIKKIATTATPVPPTRHEQTHGEEGNSTTRDTFYATAEVALRALHTDEFNAFGTTVAAKLRKKSDIQRHIAERIISDVLFRG
jgi:hypothetical protein